MHLGLTKGIRRPIQQRLIRGGTIEVSWKATQVKISITATIFKKMTKSKKII